MLWLIYLNFKICVSDLGEIQISFVDGDILALNQCWFLNTIPLTYTIVGEKLATLEKERIECVKENKFTNKNWHGRKTCYLNMIWKVKINLQTELKSWKERFINLRREMLEMISVNISSHGSLSLIRKSVYGKRE